MSDEQYTKFAETLQDLFLKFSEKCSKKHKFIRRKRSYDSFEWLRTCLTWIATDDPTLSSLANLFAEHKIKISNPALHKKFNSSCIDYLTDFLQQTVKSIVTQSNAKTVGLLNNFSGTYIGDCTSLNLS